jgi:hypothetical protein
MNSREQAITLSNKAKQLMDLKKGVLKLRFFDDTIVEVRVLRIDSKLTLASFTCTIKTFQNNINITTDYDIDIIKDIE